MTCILCVDPNWSGENIFHFENWEGGILIWELIILFVVEKSYFKKKEKKNALCSDSEMLLLFYK